MLFIDMLKGQSCYPKANKSGQYLRNLNDWFRLCVSCHKIYDKTKALSVA